MTIQAISKEYCGSVGRLSPTHQTHDGDFFPSQVLAAIFHFREFSNDSLLPAESWSRHSPRRRLLTWLYPQLRCLTDGYQRR